MEPRGNLFIVSGPSGAGKSALAAAVLRAVPALGFSVSFTTRAPRSSEQDGREYHFVSREGFEKLVSEGEFLEWAKVYGNLYGTSAKQVDQILARGQDVLLDLDVQGARSIRRKRPETVTIFIMPPSYRTLRERLENRRLDKAYVIENRLRIAAQEIAQFRDYDYLIVNEELDRAAEELRSVVTGYRCRMSQRIHAAEAIIATFGGVHGKAAGQH